MKNETHAPKMTSKFKSIENYDKLIIKQIYFKFLEIFIMEYAANEKWNPPRPKAVVWQPAKMSSKFKRIKNQQKGHKRHKKAKLSSKFKRKQISNKRNKEPV